MRAPLSSRFVAIVALLSLLAAACAVGSSDFTQYKDPDNLLFEVPNSWHLYESEELGDVGGVPFVFQLASLTIPVRSGVAFDGGPSRSVANLAEPFSTSSYPIGATSVRAITPDARELISRNLLSQLVFPYTNNEIVRELVKQDFTFTNDFEGVEVIVAFNDESTASEAGLYLISVTDPDVTTMYSMAIGCSLDCFNLHLEEIAGVMDSWLVNTRTN